MLKIHISTDGCGGTFTDASGIITSPGYPNTYGDNESCIYTIDQPNGTFVKLTLLSIDIANFSGTWNYDFDYDSVDETTCGYDFLEIRDGDNTKSPLMERLCGNENDMSLPMTFMSTENHVVFRLVTISSIDYM